MNVLVYNKFSAWGMIFRGYIAGSSLFYSQILKGRSDGMHPKDQQQQGSTKIF